MLLERYAMAEIHGQPGSRRCTSIVLQPLHTQCNLTLACHNPPGHLLRLAAGVDTSSIKIDTPGSSEVIHHLPIVRAHTQTRMGREGQGCVRRERNDAVTFDHIFTMEYTFLHALSVCLHYLGCYCVINFCRSLSPVKSARFVRAKTTIVTWKGLERWLSKEKKK